MKIEFDKVMKFIKALLLHIGAALMLTGAGVAGFGLYTLATQPIIITENTEVINGVIGIAKKSITNPIYPAFLEAGGMIMGFGVITILVTESSEIIKYIIKTRHNQKMEQLNQEHINKLREIKLEGAVKSETN